MAQMQTPSTVHAEFDHMCELLEDFEPLPTYATAPHEPAPEPEPEREKDSLDQLILAGLVSPV